MLICLDNSVWLEYFLHKEEVGGSSPPLGTWGNYYLCFTPLKKEGMVSEVYEGAIKAAA